MKEKELVCKQVRVRAEEIRRKMFATVFTPNLKGMCAICTIALIEIFRRRGWRCRGFYGHFFPAGSNRGYKHCWLEDENFIYDLTATQFGDDLPCVLIVPYDDDRYLVREMEIELNGVYWKYSPEHERPTKELISLMVQAGEMQCV